MIKNFKAITLIETLVYIAIFGIFMSILIQFFLSVQINQDKVYKELELEMNQIFVTNHFNELLGDVFAFDSENELFFNEQETLEYRVLEEDLVLQVGGETRILTNNRVSVKGIYFEEIRVLDGPVSAVRVNLSFEHSGDSRVSRDFSKLIKVVNYED